MKVLGPDWPSVTALREALREVEGEDLVWGRRTHDGLQQLQKFTEAGLACPTFTTLRGEAQEWVRKGISVYGRRRNHTQGWDIVGAGYVPFVPSYGIKEKWNHKWLYRDFWVKVIPIEEEFRQHVWDGKAIRIGRKVKTEVGNHPAAMPIRSRRNGWTIDYGYKPSKEFRESLRAAAKRAVEILGYRGGAVDLVKSKGDGKIYVLEVNTAPSLRDAKTLEAYVKTIKKGRG